MAIDNANYISELDTALPLNVDPRAEGAAQIRTVKYATQQSFPNINGPVTATPARMNDVFNNTYNTVGMIMMFDDNGGTNTFPTGWVKANGVTYTLVGGAQYTVPDLRGMFIKGDHGLIEGDDTAVPPIPEQPSEAVRSTGGDNFPYNDLEASIAGHELTLDEMPEHSHSYEHNKVGQNITNAGSGARSGSNSLSVETTGLKGGGAEHTHELIAEPKRFDNQPTYYVLSYIVFVGYDAVAN